MGTMTSTENLKPMKRSFTHCFALVLLMAVTLVFFACSDNDAISDGSDSDKQENPVTDIADYTVIFWGMAGTNDVSASVDLADLAYHYQQGEIGKNVQIAGLMKTSLSKATLDGAVAPSYDKTMYFDSETIGSDSIKESDFQNLTTKADFQKLYKKAFDNMGGKVYGDTLYPLDNTDSLANFIKKAAQKFPARHYVLMLFGHGNGFSPLADTNISRACVFDAFGQRDAFGYQGGLSADAVVSAVEKSGVKMLSLFTQCCLMATLENIAAYSQVFDYGILSAETTIGGYFPQYLVNLSAAGNDEIKMQQASRKLVDYYVDEDAGQYKDQYTSHGFYVLKKSSALLSAAKEATDWFVANYAVDSQQYAIDRALVNSLASQNMEGVNQETTDSLRQVRQKIQDVLSGKTSIGNINDEEFMSFISEAFGLIFRFSEVTGFCMADVMRNAVAADLPQEKTTALKAIYEKYMVALKDMAYIRTTNKPANAVADYEYIYASPTVNIFSMHPDYFVPFPESQEELDALGNKMRQALRDDDPTALFAAMHQLLDGTIYAKFCDLGTVKDNYSSSVFDRQVGWSKFLELLQQNPSIAYCPDRWQVNQGMK